MTVSKEDLLLRRFGTHEVEIPNVGTVVIRPLSRAEVLEITGKDIPVSEVERFCISKALVNPSLTEDEVRTWQENSTLDEIEFLTAEITRVSGLSPEQPKEVAKRFHD